MRIRYDFRFYGQPQKTGSVLWPLFYGLMTVIWRFYGGLMAVLWGRAVGLYGLIPPLKGYKA